MTFVLILGAASIYANIALFIIAILIMLMMIAIVAYGDGSFWDFFCFWQLGECLGDVLEALFRKD